VKVGRVVSDKTEKTIVVAVERLVRHRLYKRVIRLTTKFAAHDEENEARVGDMVRIEESRPLSRTKRWRLVEIVTRAGEGAAEPLVSEEEATREAIHMAAHPGREHPDETGRLPEAEEQAGAGTETAATSQTADESTPEAAGETAAGGEPPREPSRRLRRSGGGEGP
jgi:small subunit ribosomal protein S17